MKHRTLVDFLEKEDIWMNIKSPDRLHFKIMNNIDRNIYNKLYLLKVFKYASLAFFSLCLIISTVFIASAMKPIRVVFIYPHSEKVQNVAIVGKFNNKQEKIPMELDEEKGIWKGVIHTRNKNVDDYVISVEESETDAAGVTNVIDNDGYGI